MADEKKERDELKEIDLSADGADWGPEVQLNLDEDAWSKVAPPPDDRRYKVKVFPAKKFMEEGKTDDGTKFIIGNLELKVIGDSTGSEDYAETMLFSKVSTYIRKGKGISTMAGLLVKMGVKVPDSINGFNLSKLMLQAIKQEPVIWIEGVWSAWDMGKEEFIKVGMKHYPRKEDGGANHIIHDSKGQEVAAKLRVTTFYGLKEYAELSKNAKPVVGSKSAKAGKGEVADAELVLD